MEIQSSKPKSSKIMKLLPKAASAITFHNLLFSPNREKKQTDHHHHNPTTKLKSYAGKGFSGPMKIFSTIPNEARSKSKNSIFETQEPTSPKISCIGQIKHKKKIKELAKLAGAGIPDPYAGKKKKRQPSAILRMFSSAAGAAVSRNYRREKPPLPDRALGLSQMTRFSSRRGGALASFDWTGQIAPSHSDEERTTPASEEEKESERVSFSGPIWISGELSNLQPKKEVNLWKRRTFDRPKPLQLNIIR